MKIVILVENLPVPFDRRVWMEATTLTDAGYKVSVICPKGHYPKLYEVISGVSIYRYPLPSLPGIFGHIVEYGIAVPIMFILSLVVLLREGFDVIQSANPPDFFFILGKFYKLLGKKFVFDHHDLVPETCETRWTGWKMKIMRRISLLAERATFHTADRVISTNQSFREIAMTRGKITPEKVYVVRSAPSREKFRPLNSSGELRKRQPFWVCYLGVMGPNDGVDYLLKAINYIVYKLKRDDIQFTLIGGGDFYPKMVQMSNLLQIHKYVQFMGQIQNDEKLINILSMADVCVAPDPKDAMNDLSTMNKIVEYMALGKPIVAFDLRETRVSAGDAAVYAQANDHIDFAHKIIELLSSPEKRHVMGLIARQRFENHLAWEHQRESLLALYRELLRRPY